MSIQQFEAEVDRLMKKYHIQGSIVALQKDDEIVYEKAFGYRDVEKEEEATIETVFGIASLTKSFTCVGIMQLVEQGKIDLQAPIIDYIPSFTIADKDQLPKITVHHFMTHSSSLPPLPSLDYSMEREWNEAGMVDYKESYEGAVPVQTYDELLRFIDQANVKLLGEVGSIFSYSNDAYGLLGLVIENVTGIPYEQYLEEYVFKPCDLHLTHFHIEEYGDDAELTTCYEKHESTDKVTVYRVQDWWDAPPMRATGFLKSTAADLLQYSKLFIYQGVVDGVRILSEDSVKQMTSPHMKMDPLYDYGYGFGMPRQYFGKKLLEHGGSLQSVSAKFGIIPEDNLSVIVLANTSGFAATRVMYGLLNTYYGRDLDDYPFDLDAYDLSDDVKERYLGHYASGEGMDVKFVKENDGIQFYYKDEPYPVRFLDEHVFIAEMDDSFEPCEVIVDDQGQPSAISIFHRIVPKLEE